MVYDVCEGSNGAIWFGTYDGDLIRCDLALGFQRFSRQCLKGKGRRSMMLNTSQSGWQMMM